MRKYALLVVVLLLALTTALPTAAQDEQPPLISEVLLERAGSTDAPEFTILLAALQVADPAFLQRVSDPEIAAATFTTVFAPTDAAFTALLAELEVTPEELLAQPELVSQVLAYHIVPGIFTAENFAARSDTLYGTFVPHTALVVTVDGEAVKIDSSNVVEADIPAFNGIIHVVDAVLLPATLGMEEPEMTEAPEQSLYEILQSREDFSYFLELMDMMGFQTDLMVTNYTLFLPTNEVFDAFFESVGVTKEDLFANTDTITPVAFYHFLSGTFTAEDLALITEGEGQAVFGTQQPGTFMTLAPEGETFSIDGGAATVVEADLLATNGVIHVIDAILLPSGE